MDALIISRVQIRRPPEILGAQVILILKDCQRFVTLDTSTILIDVRGAAVCSPIPKTECETSKFTFIIRRQAEKKIPPALTHADRLKYEITIL